MQLNDKALDKFQQLHQTLFGEPISRAVAIQKGMQLVALMRLIYRPMTKADLKRIMQRRKELGL